MTASPEHGRSLFQNKLLHYTRLHSYHRAIQEIPVFTNARD